MSTEAVSSLPKAPVVVVGAGGMLGRAWSELLASRGIETQALDRSQLDIESRDAIERVIRPGVGVVVNCAAWTDVDGAEAHEAAATRINGTCVGWLAERCAAVDSMLVHYSTDYVFSGRSASPYPASASHQPVNAYGRSKALGERLVFESGARALLVRTSWVYAAWGGNFVRTMLKLGSEKATLKVVNDQRGRPSSARELAKNTLRLVEMGQTGTFHLTDDGECTWYELASHIMSVAGLPCRVEPCTSREFPRPAVRPPYSVLDLSAAKAVLGSIVPWQQAVRDVLSDLKAAPQ